ncbi:MAG: hypothetical protein ACP5I8_15300, partial [Phycisphaerae bacterium]
IYMTTRQVLKKNSLEQGVLLGQAPRADQVTVRVLRRRSDLAKAECLATHLFNPSGNGIGPAKQKYGKKCPVCWAKNEIKRDIEALFRLR